MSDQPQALQTRMPVSADDEVVVHRDAERAADIDDRLGHLDVGLRRRRIAGGMVVRQDTAFNYRIEKPKNISESLLSPSSQLVDMK
jgi:hypothetical protein